jgi:hypothetical protein
MKDNNQLIILGSELKMLDNGKVGGYLVKFTDASNPDLEGDFFTKDTDFDIEDGDRATVYFHHGLDRKMGNRKLGRGTLKTDDAGVWIEAWLEIRDEYEKAIKERLIDANKAGWSSGTIPSLVDREPVGGAMWVKSWPLGKDATITPIPAAGTNNTKVISLKKYKQLSEQHPSLKALLPESDQETTDVEAVDEGAQTETVPEEPSSSNEDEIMDNETVWRS